MEDESFFEMCKHGDRSKIDTFICGSNPPELFTCEICLFGTNLKVDLCEHFRVFHEEKEANDELENILQCYRCRNCDFGTHSMLILTKHNQNCDTVSSLTTKSEKWSKWRSSEGVKWFECTHCAFATKRRNYLKVHFLNKHSTAPKDTNRFKCEKCPFECRHKSNLRRHITSRHVDPDDIKWLKCDECGFHAKRRDHLRNHTLMKHTRAEDINWFECDDCDFKAKLKGTLRRHMLTRHANAEDTRWFKCERCAFQTKYEYSLKSHILVHIDPEDVNWLKCGNCTYKTARKANLKQHIAGQHRVKRTN